MRRLGTKTWGLIRQNWSGMFLFELCYRAVTLPVYLRMAGRGLQFALQKAGYSYLTAGNIGIFFLKPWTILTLLWLAAAGTFLLVLEAAALITALEGSAYGKRLTPLHIFWGGIQKAAEEVQRKNVRLFLMVLVQYGFVNLFLICRALSHVKPVSFVMQELMGEPVVQTVVILVLAALALWALQAMFVCHGCMLEQKSYQAAVRRSRSLLAGHYAKAAGMVAAGSLAAVLLTAAVYVVSAFAAAVFVVLFTEQSLAMAVLLSVSDRLELLILFLGSIFLTIVSMGTVSVLYDQYGSNWFCDPARDFSYPARGSAGRRRLAAVVVVGLAACLFYIFDLVHNGMTMPDGLLSEIQITAHRGSSGRAPENTMAAIRAAVEEMADAVEIDVQLTADGVAVLGHDASLKRVAGVNRSIGSMTWDELCQLDVGAWFSEEFRGERIPALQEVLEYCKGAIGLNIEIKNVGKNSALPGEVARLVLEQGMEEQCVLTSTSLSYLTEAKAAAPQLRTGYIISAAYGDFYSGDAVDFISIRSSFVNERLVENVHAQGKTVHAWTVNSKKELERLRLLGVDGVITDDPVLAREILYREEAAETLMEYLQMVFY